MKKENPKNIQKEIDKLFKKLDIDTNKKECFKNQNLYDYKLKTKFPTKFSSGNLTITNSTK